MMNQTGSDSSFYSICNVQQTASVSIMALLQPNDNEAHGLLQKIFLQVIGNHQAKEYMQQWIVSTQPMSHSIDSIDSEHSAMATFEAFIT